MRAQVRISQPKVASVPLAMRACRASSSVAAGKVSSSASACSPYSPRIVSWYCSRVSAPAAPPSMVISSAFDPTMTGTSCCRPAAKVS